MIGKRIRKMIQPDKGCKFAGELNTIPDNEIVNLFFQTLDWCRERSLPSIQMLKMNIPYFYHNETVNVPKNVSKAAFINCEVTINMYDYQVGEFYLRNCVAKINSHDNAKIFVWSDNSEIETNGEVFLL